MINDLATIRNAWEDETFELIGVTDNYQQTIDRDQAVDGNCKAIFDAYVLTRGVYGDEDYEEIHFDARAMEDFASDW